MAGATRQPRDDIGRAQRDPLPSTPRAPFPFVMPRVIDIAWASIADDDLQPGELVANQNDNSFVWRKDDTNIYRFDNDATRAI